MHRLIPTWLAAVIFVLPLAARAQGENSLGSSNHGKKLIASAGCGSCHEIPGIPNANGVVGPPLDNIGSRIIIAGMLPNKPPDLIRWLMSPQSIVPGNAMPDMGLSERDAADIAAYLYTLR